MKKLIFAILAAAAVMPAAAANPVVNNPDNRAYWGVRVSLDVSVPEWVESGAGDTRRLEDLYTAGCGVGVGVIYNIPVVANLYIEPGLNLYYNTTGIKVDEDLDHIDWIHHSNRKFGMRIPVVAGYHFDFRRDVSLAVFCGPELNVGFSNDYYYTAKYDDNGMDIERTEAGSNYRQGGFNRVDLAVKAGVQLNWKHWMVGVNGSAGCCNMINNRPGGSSRMNTNSAHIELGYNF